MNKIFKVGMSVACVMLTACADHDDPELAPIDTTQVKITSDITVAPSAAWSWYERSEELTVKVADVKMTAPKGVVLRSVDLMVNGGHYLSKPYSGESLEFKVPLVNVAPGRLNMSVIGNLIQKDARDAEILIADNLQQTVFEVMPDFECKAAIDVTVTGRSTTGEELNRTFKVESNDRTINVPQEDLYWTPSSGTAGTLDVTMTASAEAWSTNSTLEAVASRVYWSGDVSATKTYKLTLDNTPGSLAAKKCAIMVETTRYGVWEGVNTGETKLIYSFSVTEE